eukprot:3235949-Pyramimonas_sp.AAC.1
MSPACRLAQCAVAQYTVVPYTVAQYTAALPFGHVAVTRATGCGGVRQRFRPTLVHSGTVHSGTVNSGTVHSGTVHSGTVALQIVYVGTNTLTRWRCPGSTRRQLSAPDSAVAAYLAKGGVRRVVVGHKPVCDPQWSTVEQHSSVQWSGTVVQHSTDRTLEIDETASWLQSGSQRDICATYVVCGVDERVIGAAAMATQ